MEKSYGLSSFIEINVSLIYTESEKFDLLYFALYTYFCKKKKKTIPVE